MVNVIVGAPRVYVPLCSDMECYEVVWEVIGFETIRGGINWERRCIHVDNGLLCYSSHGELPTFAEVSGLLELSFQENSR